MFWGEEGVSIHAENEVNTEQDRRDIGNECSIKFGKKMYSGKIACCGTYRLYKYKPRENNISYLSIINSVAYLISRSFKVVLCCCNANNGLEIV